MYCYKHGPVLEGRAILDILLMLRLDADRLIKS